MTTLTPEQEHLRKIATPLRLMQTVGKAELGYEVQTPPHLLYLESRILEAVLDREHQRFIIVTLPPRHGKTSTIGVGLPAWYLGMFPNDQVIYASYAEDFAVKQGRKVRDLHAHHGLSLFGRGVSKDAFAAADWKLEGTQGGMLSAGNGGPITGVGAHLCVAAGTLVSTPSGPVEISTIARNGGTVWAYDHDSSQIVARRVLRGVESSTDDVVRLTFASGRSLIATPDHPIWVDGRGYVDAELVEVGAQVRAMDDPALRDLRQGGATTGLRHDEGAQASGRRGLLRSLLRPGGQPTSLRAVSVSAATSSSKALRRLLGRLPLLSPTPGTNGLLVVSGELPAPEQSEQVLLQDMREQRPLRSDARSGELALATRPELRAGLRPDAPTDPGTRRREVRCVWNHNGDAGRPSHRRGHQEQSASQLGGAVSPLPHEAPQVEGDTVALVEHLRGGDHLVYDLTVEGTHNFFAGEVLVHNCIGDDLIKNARDANSEAEKAALIEWYDEVLRTRLEPGGTLILFFTRWRVDDLIGTLLERMELDTEHEADQYEVINLPALATLPDEIDPGEDPDAAAAWTDVLGRHVGDALWPKRFPAPMLHQMRANKSDTFQAMFQGDPRIKEGGMFPRDKWRYYTADAVPEPVRRLRIWDLAASEASGDWTVGALWGTTADGRLVLYDVQRFRKDPSGVQSMVVSTAARDTAAVPILIEEERAGAGKTVVALYAKVLRGYNVEGVRPEGDKELRAKPYSTIAHGGEVWLPSEAPWLEMFLAEHEGFPKMKHDDMVDTGSYATQKLVAVGETTMLLLQGLLTSEAEMNSLVSQFAAASSWG